MTRYTTDMDPTTRETEGNHGVLRDDGQKDRPKDEGVSERIDEGNNPVLMPRDGRHPNAPGTLNSDTGAEATKAGAKTPAPDTQELEDAYSQNDPGVETKQ